MFSKILILVIAVFFQTLAVLSQSQSQFSGFVSPGKTAAEMWNPYTWITPYYTAASKTWTDYLQKAQDVSHQLYQQWDKTGAGDPFALGMQYAQLAVSQAQKGAEAAMNQAQKGAETAMSQAGSIMPKAKLND